MHARWFFEWIYRSSQLHRRPSTVECEELKKTWWHSPVSLLTCVFMMFILIPCHTPFKYRCLINRSKRITPQDLRRLQEVETHGNHKRQGSAESHLQHLSQVFFFLTKGPAFHVMANFYIIDFLTGWSYFSMSFDWLAAKVDCDWLSFGMWRVQKETLLVPNQLTTHKQLWGDNGAEACIPRRIVLLHSSRAIIVEIWEWFLTWT